MAVSLTARLIAGILPILGVRRSLERDFLTPPARPAGEGRPPKGFVRRFQLTEGLFQGRSVYELTPRAGVTADHRYCYLHGGGFVANNNPPNWWLVARLVEATGATVVVPDYPLAPEHPAPAAADFVRDFYTEYLLPKGPAANLVLLGDSAGAALALGLCQELVATGGPLPSRLALLWPWLDLTLSDPLSAEIEPTDLLLTIRGIRAAARHYAGPNADLHTFNPLNRPLAGLPPMDIFVGTCDLLLPDARRLRAAAEQAGVPVAYHEYPGMMHGWMMLTLLPEARRAIAELAASLQLVVA